MSKSNEYIFYVFVNDSLILNDFSLLTCPNPLVKSFSYQPVAQYCFVEWINE